MSVKRRKLVHAFVCGISNSVVPFPLSPSPNYVNRLAGGDRFQHQRLLLVWIIMGISSIQLVKLTKKKGIAFKMPAI